MMKTTNQKFILILMVVFAFFSCQETSKIDPNYQKRATASIIEDNLEVKSITDLSKDFFEENSDLTDQSELINSTVSDFLAINGGLFQGSSVCKIVPMYAYGIDGVAYYEIWFTEDGQNPKGWVLISATEKDYPIANFSHDGVPYSKSAYTNAEEKKGVNKIYRFSQSYVVAENQQGSVVGEQGVMPKFILKETGVSFGLEGSSDDAELKQDNVELEEGVDYVVIEDYETLKQVFAENFYTETRANKALAMKQEIKTIARQKADWIYRWVPGTKMFYTQIPPNSSVNGRSCYSGCNNNAWAGIFGWWDANQSKSRLIPTASNGETCPTTRSNSARRAVIDPVQMYCASVCGTFCDGNGGATYFSKAYLAYKYTTAKSYGYSYSSWWCNSAGCNSNMADILTECTGNNLKPCHIGANSHFYIANGYAQWSNNTDRTWAYCYPGWRTDNNDNVWIHWDDFNSATRLYVR